MEKNERVIYTIYRLNINLNYFVMRFRTEENKMAKKCDFDNIERVCAFCEHGMVLPPDNDGNILVLCDRKGLVHDNGWCRRFLYDPLKREPKEPLSIPDMKVIDIDD